MGKRKKGKQGFNLAGMSDLDYNAILNRTFSEGEFLNSLRLCNVGVAFDEISLRNAVDDVDMEQYKTSFADFLSNVRDGEV